VNKPIQGPAVVEQRESTEVVMITGHASVESAVEALRQRIRDWLVVALLALSVVIALLVSLGAMFGGALVYEYGFNVENVSEVWEETEQDHVRLPRPGASE
jgi:ActR/RegA family two-component response regulator